VGFVQQIFEVRAHALLAAFVFTFIALYQFTSAIVEIFITHLAGSRNNVDSKNLDIRILHGGLHIEL
jgi:hypothetical protein